MLDSSGVDLPSGLSGPWHGSVFGMNTWSERDAGLGYIEVEVFLFSFFFLFLFSIGSMSVSLGLS